MCEKVLRDPISRGAYDRQLQQQEVSSSIIPTDDEVHLDEMFLVEEAPREGTSGEPDPDPVGVCYGHPCRCGDLFLLHKGDIPACTTSLVVPCRSCSAHLLVLLPPCRQGEG